MNKCSLVKKIINLHGLKKSYLSMLMAGISYGSSYAFAEQIFNPAFLDDGTSDMNVSDLSKFNQRQYQPQGVYRVEIFVNESRIKTQDIRFIEKENEKGQIYLFPCFDKQSIDDFGINIDKSMDKSMDESEVDCIDFVSRIPKAQSEFVFEKQRLNLSFPQASIRNNVRGYIPPEEWDDGINTLFTNYMISAYKNENKNLFVNLNSGFNLGSWQFRNDANFSYNSIGEISNSKWNSVNSYVKKNLIPIKSTLLFGESTTKNDIFDGLAFTGLSLSSSEEMYPDSQQGYAPIIRGIAQTNANIIVKQNGYTIYQITVSPGPFVIEDLNPTSVSGDLKVEIEETNGTSQSFIVPYSTLPILQRQNRVRYDLTVGKNRNNYDNANTSKFLQSTVAYGLSNRTSIYGGTQLSNNYKSGLLGVGQNLGKIGAVSFDITHSITQLNDHSEKTGQSMRFLYAKSLLKSGTTFRLLGYRYSTQDFYTFNEAMNDRWDLNNQYLPDHSESYVYSNYPRKGRFEANISHSFGGDKGSFFITGTEQNYWGTKAKNRWVQAGYSAVYKDINFSLSVSNFKYDTTQQDDTSFSASMSFQTDAFFRKKDSNQNIFNRASISSSITGSSEGNTAFRSGISGTLLENRNLRYSLGQGVGETVNTTSLGLDYSGRYGAIGAGYSHDSSGNQMRFNASGTAVAHSKGVTFGQYLNGTGILVEVPQASGISVDNHPGIKTDWRGYAIIPYASAYRENRISLNPNSFSDEIEIENNVSTSVPTDGAITKASFKPRIGARALISLYHNNKPVPYVSSVIEESTSATGLVDSSGAVYLAGLPQKGTLKVVWGQRPADQCYAYYDITGREKSNIILFDLICK